MTTDQTITIRVDGDSEKVALFAADVFRLASKAGRRQGVRVLATIEPTEHAKTQLPAVGSNQ